MLRDEMLDRIRAGEFWDLVVVGGGATGLGTAVDAAARGYRTLLLEAFDFAKGTSSRSTKLVHGGVRYLAQGRIGLVREALHERGRLSRNAPHLVHVLPFVVPSYSWWARPYYAVGLKLYDLLAGRLSLGASRSISRAEVHELASTVEPAGLRGGIVYYDGQFDDSRLAITLLRTFLDLGGTALNYAPVSATTKDAGRTSGVIARDTETGTELTIRARVVINATGVFADALRRLDEPQATGWIVPSQGAHLVLERSFLPGSAAVMVPRTNDGRVLFAIPWHDHVVVGTTDTPVSQVSIEPRPLGEEIAFLLEHAARYLSRDPKPRDVLSTYAGLRPLVRSPGARSTADLSRTHKLLVSESGLVTITGGKWTTYRRMGADAVNRAARVASLAPRPCVTESLKLLGWTESAPEGWLGVYGSEAPDVERLCNELPGGRERVHPNLPFRAGEVIWAARIEMARTVEDVLARRTRALFLDARASHAAAHRVAALLAAELGRDAVWQHQQVRQFQELAEGYLVH